MVQFERKAKITKATWRSPKTVFVMMKELDEECCNTNVSKNASKPTQEIKLVTRSTSPPALLVTINTNDFDSDANHNTQQMHNTFGWAADPYHQMYAQMYSNFAMPPVREMYPKMVPYDIQQTTFPSLNAYVFNNNYLRFDSRAYNNNNHPQVFGRDRMNEQKTFNGNLLHFYDPVFSVLNELL